MTKQLIDITLHESWEPKRQLTSLRVFVCARTVAVSKSKDETGKIRG